MSLSGHTVRMAVKASWLPGKAGVGRPKHLPSGVGGERMSKRGEELPDGGVQRRSQRG